MRILVVDENPETRSHLLGLLREWGYDPLEARDTDQARDLHGRGRIPCVISTAGKNGGSGIDLCRWIRSTANGSYTYVILLPDERERQEILLGMEAGADDFVTKPLDPDILRVRIRAGERLLHLERSLLDRTRALEKANRAMEMDLEAAGELQRSLLPRAMPEIPGYRIGWAFEPCAHVAGDILNVFRLDETRWGLYVLDVSGHGVPAAMISVAVARLLTPIQGQASLVKKHVTQAPRYDIAHPCEVVSALREQFPADSQHGLYFTVTYMVLDIRTSRVTWLRAGHTPPLLVREGRDPVLLEDGGGPPVGLFADSGDTDLAEEHRMEPGERIYLYSDGITEAFSPGGEPLGEERFGRFLTERSGIPLVQSVEEALAMAGEWVRPREFQDDVTVLGIERVP